MWGVLLLSWLLALSSAEAPTVVSGSAHVQKTHSRGRIPPVVARGKTDPVSKVMDDEVLEEGQRQAAMSIGELSQTAEKDAAEEHQRNKLVEVEAMEKADGND